MPISIEDRYALLVAATKAIGFAKEGSTQLEHASLTAETVLSLEEAEERADAAEQEVDALERELGVAREVARSAQIHAADIERMLDVSWKEQRRLERELLVRDLNDAIRSAFEAAGFRVTFPAKAPGQRFEPLPQFLAGLKQLPAGDSRQG